MSISINVTIDKEETSMTLTIDDGTGEVKSVVIPVQLESKKEKKPTKKKAAEPAPTTPQVRPTIDPVFMRFLQTGDITELREYPDVKRVFKNYVFVKLVELKGRTIHVDKAVGAVKRIVGIMPPAYWDDDLVNGLTETLKNGPQRAVIFTDGSRPFVVNDMVFLEEEWNSLGRLFNSLYSKPREE